jgi:hypothetical protein
MCFTCEEFIAWIIILIWHANFVQVEHGQQVEKLLTVAKVPKGTWNLLNLLNPLKLKEINY